MTRGICNSRRQSQYGSAFAELMLALTILGSCMLVVGMIINATLEKIARIAGWISHP